MRSVRPRILLIQAPGFFRRALGDALEREGMYVALASAQKQALEALQRSPFQVVILDLHIPKKDGLALLSALRESSHAADLPILVLSSRKGPTSSETHPAGASCHCEKESLRVSELVKRIRSIAKNE